MNPAEMSVKTAKSMSAMGMMKQLGFAFPAMQSLPIVTIRLSRTALMNCAAGIMLLGVLAYAQCSIDIPGVDIPDLKDVPGVWEWLQEVGIHQTSVNLFNLQ